MYRLGIKKTTHFKRPLIVVGNISIGGSGKTPLVIAIVEYLQQQGLNIGVVSRGYGGKYRSGNLVVSNATDASICGDEPSLIKQTTDAIMVVNKNRTQAVKKVIELGAEVVISDDGLQHYAMGRDVEIAVIDSSCNLGNGYLLPSGTLREPLSRLKTVDMVVYHKRLWQGPAHSKLLTEKSYKYEMVLEVVKFVNVKTKQSLDSGEFVSKYGQVYAVCGIAQPDDFFAQLSALGLSLETKSYADHYRFRVQDFAVKEDKPILMTAKDCVKCSSFATEQMWYLQVKAKLTEDFFIKLKQLL